MSHAKRSLLRLALGVAALVATLAPADRGRGDDGHGGGGDDLVVLANRDDDDRDGRPDADDDRVNGPADERDLAALVVPCPAGARLVRVEVDGVPLRFFRRGNDGWQHLGQGRIELPLAPDGAAELSLQFEALAWAGTPEAATGRGQIAVTFEGPTGPIVVHDRGVRVAAVRLMPSTAPVDEVYVATGRYDNAAFVERLRGILAGLEVPLTIHPTADWREMWMQDTMEVGGARSGTAAMGVVLAGLRGADGFPPTLLGPDVAVAEIAAPRPLAGGDAWADWYGNLEVSIPTAAHPAGRVIHGRNRLTGSAFHPEVVAFLAAQETQPPVWIDTSWLLIKHVDEIVAFLPGADGRGAVLVPDPLEGLRLLEAQPGAAAGAEANANAGAKPSLARLREVNARIARAIDALLGGDDELPRAGAVSGRDEGTGLLPLLGLDESRVVRLPVAFDVPDAGLLADGGVTDASSLWSNPVNALIVNGTVICGSAGMPDAVQAICRERFLAAGATAVEFIDDGVYQKNHGNVHCATNTRRE